MADTDYTKLSISEKLEIARNRRGTAEKPAEKKSNTPVSLPIWPDTVRAIPNWFLRSALFPAIRKGQDKRRHLNRELMAAFDGTEILYKGDQLDQGDLTVWATLIHVARLQELGSKCRITSYALLKLMGQTDCGKNRETLHSRIIRLKANAIEVKQGRHTYIGGFIANATKDNETQEWIIEIDPKIESLFAPNQFTQIDWAIRYTLEGKPLAQWLHGFYASHAEPFPICMETLIKLSGSENENPRSAQQKLRKALDAVTEVSTAHGQPFAYEVQGDDLVHVQKKASGPQRRHLAKKAATTPRKPRA